MGCVTTRKAYRDYRLSLEYRYVDNDVQLNKKNARDGGILFQEQRIGELQRFYFLAFREQFVRKGFRERFPDVFHLVLHRGDGQVQAFFLGLYQRIAFPGFDLQVGKDPLDGVRYGA